MKHRREKKKEALSTKQKTFKKQNKTHMQQIHGVKFL